MFAKQSSFSMQSIEQNFLKHLKLFHRATQSEQIQVESSPFCFEVFDFFRENSRNYSTLNIRWSLRMILRRSDLTLFKRSARQLLKH